MVLVRRTILLSVVWGTAWAVLAAAVGGFGIPYVPAHVPSWSDFVFIDGAFGLVCGAVFGLLLVLAERRRPLRRVSLEKGALWGFVAGCAVVWVDQLGNCAIVGTVSGLLTVTAARLRKVDARLEGFDTSTERR